MWQKVNPHGLRVNVVQSYDASWYSDKKGNTPKPFNPHALGVSKKDLENYKKEQESKKTSQKTNEIVK